MRVGFDMVFLLLLAACAQIPNADLPGTNHLGMHFERNSEPADKGIRIRVASSASVFGGDMDQVFARAARGAADQQHCNHYRVDEERFSQENTLFGTRQVREAIIRCE